MKPSLFLIFLSFSFFLHAKDITSKVESVVIFQNKAKVNRTASFTLEKGFHQLNFVGISTAIDPNSIQIKGLGNMKILGTRYQTNFLNENALPKNLQSLKDQIDQLQNESKKLQNQKISLEEEQKFLQANQSVTGENENLSLENLKKIAFYYRNRILQILNALVDVEEKIISIEKEKNKLQRQYNDQTQEFRKNSGNIVVEVSVSSTSKMELTLLYLVSSVSWESTYDLHSQSVNEPVTLTYKAIITQNTGENWENVQLSLSTGNPIGYRQIPKLDKTYIDFVEEENEPIFAAQNENFRQMRKENAIMYDSESAIQHLEIDENPNTLQMRYSIQDKFTILSGQKPVTVNIKDEVVEATYEYRSIPKLEESVFLLATLKNPNFLTLIPGFANIYFEGDFVGKMYLNKTEFDQLNISFGVDKNITIERKTLQDKTTRQTIGSSLKETFVYKWMVKNNKNTQVEVSVYDQIPLSKHSDIKIKMVEDIDNAQFNMETGEMVWKIQAHSGQKIEETFGYEIKYPKGKKIKSM